MSAEALRSERDKIGVGEYRFVYDPSVGEAEPWYKVDWNGIVRSFAARFEWRRAAKLRHPEGLS